MTVWASVPLNRIVRLDYFEEVLTYFADRLSSISGLLKFCFGQNLLFCFFFIYIYIYFINPCIIRAGARNYHGRTEFIKLGFYYKKDAFIYEICFFVLISLTEMSCNLHIYQLPVLLLRAPRASIARITVSEDSRWLEVVQPFIINRWNQICTYPLLQSWLKWTEELPLVTLRDCSVFWSQDIFFSFESP